MIPDRMPPEPTFWQASLNGYACEAYAWLQTTSLDVLDGTGQRKTVEGVRRWRGRAFIDRAAFPGGLPQEARLHYAGKICCGEEERDIDAEVFLCYARTLDPDGPARPDDGCAYIEFIGAGTPFRREEG